MGHEVLDTLPFPRGQTAGAGLTLASPAGDGSRISPMATGALNSSKSPFFDNDGTSSSKFRPDIIGKIFHVRDTKNGTDQDMLLRAVQLNCSGGTSSGTTAVPGNAALVVGAATAVGGPGTALQMGNPTVPATHGRQGGVVMAGGAGATAATTPFTAGVANTATTAAMPAKPLDDSYPVGMTLLVADIIYVVEKGPCTVPVNSGQTVTIGKEAACHSDGSFRDAADGETVVGTWISVSGTSGSTGSTSGVLDVKAGYQDDKTGA